MRFNFSGFLLRFAIALVLVLVTYNPTFGSYVGWVWADMESQLSLKVLAGLILLVVYIIFLRATLRSIGAIGMVLLLAIIAAVVWVLTDLGALDIGNEVLLTWIILVAMAFVMAVGVSWSHVRRRISGQADVDDVDAWVRLTARRS